MEAIKVVDSTSENPCVSVRVSSKSLGYIIFEPRVSIQKCVPFSSVDVEILHWISEKCDLLVVLEERSDGFF